VALLLAAFLAGLAIQRATPGGKIRDAFWMCFFWGVSPALVLVTFLHVRVSRGLLFALAAAALASWGVALAAFVYAKLVTRERDEQGALMLTAGWPNTGFLGYPVAQLAFGPAALSLAVLYDRLAWVVPASAVSATVARVFGRRGRSTGRHRLALLANPPLLALVVAVAMRSVGLDLPEASTVHDVAARLVGPAGFLLLGLSIPLRSVRPPANELLHAVGALTIRFVGGPLALFASGAALGASIPAVFYLLAAMPPAFHLLVLARIYDVRPVLTRMTVIWGTVVAVPLLTLAFALGH
jgi:predicted permease